MSKNTIFELAFCVMSRSARSNNSLNSMMLRSLMKGAKRDANCSSLTVIYVSRGSWKLYMKFSRIIRLKYTSSRFCFSRPKAAIH